MGARNPRGTRREIEASDGNCGRCDAGDARDNIMHFVTVGIAFLWSLICWALGLLQKRFETCINRCPWLFVVFGLWSTLGFWVLGLLQKCFETYINRCPWPEGVWSLVFGLWSLVHLGFLDPWSITKEF